MYYNVTVSYRHDQEQVHLAESQNLAEMKRLGGHSDGYRNDRSERQ